MVTRKRRGDFIFDRRALPAHEGILQDILCICGTSEHAIGDGEEQSPVLIEDVYRFRRHATQDSITMAQRFGSAVQTTEQHEASRR